MILLELDNAASQQGSAVWTVLRLAALIVIGLPGVWLLGRWIRALISRKFTAQQGMIAGKAVFYTGFIVVSTMSLNQLGYQLTALLGALGIAGVAAGFAARTSASNVIGGVFLIIENPFSIGDVIKVGETLGEVTAIDLFSAKIRTFDNKLVRIPNETLVGATIVNFSRFPIRRVDIDVTVSYSADLGKVKETLLEAATKNPLSLAEPGPALFFSSLTDKGVSVFLGVWTRASDFGELKNALIEDIRSRFVSVGIAGPATQVELKQPPEDAQEKPPASGKGRKKRSR